jgi:hypothetical protein
VIISAASAGLLANLMSSGTLRHGTCRHPWTTTSADRTPVDESMPTLGGIHQVDPDLGVLDPARDPGVLTLHPDGVDALLQITGLMHHHHCIGVPGRAS